MVNYSVTIDILPRREQEWVAYMLEHIQHVLDTGHFMDFSFKKLDSVLDGYERYQVEYYCKNMEEYEAYQGNGASKLQADHTKRFDGAFKAERHVTRYKDVLDEVFYGDAERRLFHAEPA